MQGNYIGTDKDGETLLGTGFFGVLMNQSAEQNLVGGTAPGARNVIAGQSDSTIAITFTNNNIVQGNYIGTNAAGTAALGKAASGVCIYSASSNLVGGDTEAARNVISGNCKRGVLLLGDGGGDTANNIVQGNYIGTDATGKVGVGNQLTGVGICGVVNNTIGLALDGTGAGNRIAFNKGDGVRIYLIPNVTAAARNTVRGNEIYGNDGLGINLQPEQETNVVATLNDEGDADSGPNNGQNYPIITDASTADGKANIAGTLNSTANTKFIIDFYRNKEADASKYGEGEEYLGNAEVTTDAVGNAAFVFKSRMEIADGFFTATATNTITGDTSEFSANVEQKH